MMKIAEHHVQTWIRLLQEQWCTDGTKEELADHIRSELGRTLGDYMVERYTVQDIMERLSEPVECQPEDGEASSRHHYLFNAGQLSYIP